ncbi:LysR family transcriptional regulator [Octadecabacter sp. 1_MG-2023]|uniref:LysR family transcriptional regulator n=1 Tax=unclassified Octadecabacter TaxID=196158 RepID=UPI001C09CDB9|nr:MULTISPECIES: LysR family transcriptional regulator [unclassified Octadecabacter]MBU2994290.1 LysR family transcriptional regulator [Octadecabacter sp. B2R22]MDO6734421.1 LysR family transcriptional regulator [Octadecabacter sp. 1_MG-2023]
MDNWDEIRTAYQVAQIGTVSGAADALGVHHATVIRHIDALEERLGVKLFQRHARGYTATEAGQDLMQVATATDDQFAQLEGRIRGHGEGVSGDLVVTSLVMLSPVLTPVLARFRQENPDLTVRFLTGDRLFRLEYGEAHVAIRAGKAPDQPDNVVQPFLAQTVHLVAAPSYIERNGLPSDEADLRNHWFVGNDSIESRAPFYKWLAAKVPQNNVVFRTTDIRTTIDAVLAGAGIGFVTSLELKAHPELVEVIPSKPDWSGQLWLVTHVDLHRTTKVQAFLSFLKEEAKSWEI